MYLLSAGFRVSVPARLHRSVGMRARQRVVDREALVPQAHRQRLADQFLSNHSSKLHNLRSRLQVLLFDVLEDLEEVLASTFQVDVAFLVIDAEYGSAK